MTVQDVLVKSLGALPVIRAYMDRVHLTDRVDALAPVRSVAHLTNGEVVMALVAHRLTAPRPLYDIEHWAEHWAAEAVLGVCPADLNDDRLGRGLDDLAAVHDHLRGDLTVQAIRAFGLATKTLRWDLTSVLVTGAYPPGEQDPQYAQVRYGDGGERQQHVRYLQVTTDDGAAPVWEQVHDGNTNDVTTVIATRRSWPARCMAAYGNTNDVTTVIATMEALREHAQCQDVLLVGASTLLSDGNRRGLLVAGVGYLGPLARTPELDAACLAIPAEAWAPLDYLSAHERRTPPEERGQ